MPPSDRLRRGHSLREPVSRPRAVMISGSDSKAPTCIFSGLLSQLPSLDEPLRLASA